MSQADKWYRRFKDYLVVSRPNAKGEWRARCPTHDDKSPSASFNFEKGVFNCLVCGGSSLRSLANELDGNDVDAVGKASYNPFDDDTIVDLEAKRAEKEAAKGKPETLTEAKVLGWHAALLDNEDLLTKFMAKRGLTLETIERFKLGWDRTTKRITIPVYDSTGALVNIRKYLMDADGQKMNNAYGHGSPARLYPIAELDNDEVMLTEGELDALVAIQNGFHAVSGTGGAKKWEPAWTRMFSGKDVVVSYDNDRDGRVGAKRAARSLRSCAASVIVMPPLTSEEKSDITDYFVEGGKPQALRSLIERVRETQPVEDDTPPEVMPIRVIGTMDATTNGRPLELSATVVGKKGPTYSVPARLQVECSMDAGTRCGGCVMLEAEGEMDVRVERHDVETISRLIDTPEDRRTEVIRKKIGAVKCNKLVIVEVQEQHTVEELTVMGSIDHASDEEADYTQRRVYNVGRYETPMNTTCRVVGTTWPNPKDGRNEFFAWEMEEAITSIDSFEMTPELHDKLRIFQPTDGQSVMGKCVEIAIDLSEHVTGIYGRERMHVAMDLVWHSALQFDLHGKRLEKGWLELMVAGDTRTGKSETAMRLSRHYRLGHIIGCEGATFAGLVGGVKQTNNSWSITWGELPINDRRLAVLDEASGLKLETISGLSDIRSRGIAQLTKVESAQVPARVRTIWISNARPNKFVDEKRVDGVDIIEDIIGTPEDVARFDFAMSVRTEDVPNEKINSYHRNTTKHVYTSELCHALVLWCWSRKAENIKFTPAADKKIYEAATWLGARYVPTPPLLQVQNAREKVARVAVGFAGRTFSTDDGVNLIVTEEHVIAAVQFIHKLYSYDNFGYYRLSKRALRNSQVARESQKEVKSWLRERRRLVEFLLDRRGSSFRSQDLEEMAGMDRDDVNTVLDFLSERKMISKEKSQIVLEPELQEVLKGFDR